MEMHPVGLEGFDSAVILAPVTPRESRSMRKVNMLMRQASGSPALSDPVAFLCECQIPTCYSVVWMSALAFDTNAADGTGWLLADGHEPSGPHPTPGPLHQTAPDHAPERDRIPVRRQTPVNRLRTAGTRYLHRTRTSIRST